MASSAALLATLTAGLTSLIAFSTFMYVLVMQCNFFYREMTGGAASLIENQQRFSQFNRGEDRALTEDEIENNNLSEQLNETTAVTVMNAQ